MTGVWRLKRSNESGMATTAAKGSLSRRLHEKDAIFDDDPPKPPDKTAPNSTQTLRLAAHWINEMP